MTGRVAIGGGELDKGQSVIECGIGLARIVDNLDRAVPYRGD